MPDNKTTCQRCGKCCYFFADGKKRKCKFLVRLKDGKTLCRNYHCRLGREIYKTKDGISIVCVLRSDSMYDYLGCPLNTDKEILF